MAPDGEAANQSYQALRAAMEDRQRAAIGTVVMRSKQYLAAIRPLGGALAMSTMRFADEVMPRSEVDEIPDEPSEPDPKMLRMATQLVDSLTSDWKAASAVGNHGSGLTRERPTGAPSVARAGRSGRATARRGG